MLDTNRQINLDIPSKLEIIGDRDAFKQVMMILLDNAIKHSNKKIDVQAHLDDTGVEIRVRDYGDGIAPNVLSHIFDRFYRSDLSRQQNGESGLGLAIAKSIIQAHGGTISVTSKPDVQTTFVIRIPTPQ